MKSSKQRLFAAVGGLCGAAYLTCNNVLPSAPDLLLGLLLGLAAVLILMGLLPEERWRRLRKWKRGGE